jgi:hypothetical protein
MHTGHLILVKAESHQDAIDRVWTNLNTDTAHFAADWSDWAVVGDEGIGESRFSLEEFEQELSNKYVVSYETETEAFRTILEKFIELRQKDFDRFKEAVQDLDLASLKMGEDSDKAWKLSRFADLIWGNYTPDSAYYDLENYTPDLNHFEQSILSGETDWFGVIVDFHY